MDIFETKLAVTVFLGPVHGNVVKPNVTEDIRYSGVGSGACADGPADMRLLGGVWQWIIHVYHEMPSAPASLTPSA